MLLLCHDNHGDVLPADIILAVLWVAIASAGIVFQLVRERGRPHFPPHPWFKLKRRQRQQRALAINSSATGVDEEEDERQPLLGAPHPQLPQQVSPQLPRQPDLSSAEGTPADRSPGGSRSGSSVHDPL